jgi:glutamine synthetase
VIVASSHVTRPRAEGSSPRTLAEALACLKEDEALCAGLGKTFIDYYCRIKEAEIARANLEVSDWEQREYFDLF